MKDFKNISRRGFMGLAGMTAAGSLLMPKSGLIQPAFGASPFAPVKEEDAVIAFGHVGPISDEGWTYTHHLGKLAVEKAFPKLKTLEVENIPFSADATRTFRQFVSEGANLCIISSEYADLVANVADASPDVAWMECNGHMTSANLNWYYVKHWFPTYVVGIAAGLLSKTGKLGYVASFPVPSVYAGTNAFLMGARSVNPDATLQCIAINSWFDPQGAHQAGTALADKGCDFLFGIMDEAAYLQVAQERGIWAAMWNTDIRQYGPDSYVSSIVVNWQDYYVDQVRKRLAGEWVGNQTTLLDMGKGVDRDAWGKNVPKDVAEKADAVRTKMMDEGFNPFVGPIKDNTGKLRVKEGETMDEMALYNWDWSVEGVSGLSS